MRVSDTPFKASNATRRFLRETELLAPYIGQPHLAFGGLRAPAKDAGFKIQLVRGFSEKEYRATSIQGIAPENNFNEHMRELYPDNTEEEYEKAIIGSTYNSLSYQLGFQPRSGTEMDIIDDLARASLRPYNAKSLAMATADSDDLPDYVVYKLSEKFYSPYLLVQALVPKTMAKTLTEKEKDKQWKIADRINQDQKAGLISTPTKAQFVEAKKEFESRMPLVSPVAIIVREFNSNFYGIVGNEEVIGMEAGIMRHQARTLLALDLDA